MKKNKPENKGNLSLYFLITAVEGMAALIYLASIPSDPKNSIFLGFSASRLVLMGILAGLTLLFAWLAIQTRAKRSRIKSRIEKMVVNLVWQRLLLWVGAIFWITAWLSIFLPGYRLGRLASFHERLQPLILWAGLAGLQFLILVISTGRPSIKHRFADFVERNRRLIKNILVTFTVMLGILLIILFSGISSQTDFINFNVPGVPLLAIQVFFTWLAVVVISLLSGSLTGSQSAKPRQGFVGFLSSHKDILLTAVIWIGAFLVWVNTTFPGSFFAPGPYPPDQQFYPFSDAASYDLAAQFALIGQGLNDMLYVDKPLYSFFLLLLNLIGSGQNNLIITLQMAILAVYPGLVYWLGKGLHSRLAGLAAAILVIAKESSAIYSSRRLLNTNTHLFMSEVPTALLLVLFTYLFFRWAQQPDRRRVHFIASASVLGLATLVRHNTWFVLPFALLAIVFISGWNWRKWLLRTSLFVAFILPSIVPWMVYTGLTEYTPFYFMIPFRGAVLQDRYFRVSSTETPGPAAGAGQAITPSAPAQTQTPIFTPTPKPKANNPHDSDMKNMRNLVYLFDFLPAQLANNLRTAAILMPMDWTYHDIEHTIARKGSFWTEEWSGIFNPQENLSLMFNLGFLSIGFGFAWFRWRWAGFVPLFVFTGYILSNVIARSSGGRYIIPVEWAVFLFFAVGLVETTRWVMDIILSRKPVPEVGLQSGWFAPEDRIQPVSGWRRTVPVVLLTAVVAAFIPLSGSLFSQRYQSIDIQQFLENPQAWREFSRLADDPAALEQFLTNEEAVLLNGRLLYPRYYYKDQGEPDRFSDYSARAYPRMVFTLIGPHGKAGVILPQMEISYHIKNGSDVLVLGCRSEDNIYAAAVQIQGDHPVTILRTPGTALECPLPEPVCDENRNCE